MRRFIDIGANLTDPQFRGIYRGKRRHADDFSEILERAHSQGVQRILVTGSNFKESQEARELAHEHPGFLYATAGVHPCHAADPGVEQHWDKLEALAKKGAAEGTIKAFGEIGLDYDRLHYAPADAQRKVFAKQLEIATRVGLPLFLHSRACAKDFAEALKPVLPQIPRGGVVHSFTGTLQEMRELLGMGLYIGINGCSLKTSENLDVVRELPLTQLMLETDGPWCEIRRTHASFSLAGPPPYETAQKPEKFVAGQPVRGRCEPCDIGRVADVVAGVKGIPVQSVIDAAWKNTTLVFFPETAEP